MTAQETPVYSKKVQNAWAMYDWANSVYSLVITTTIFPIFYNAMTTVREEDGTLVSDVVTFWGMEFLNTQLYSYVLATSFLVIIFLSPLLSGMADYAGKKLTFMKVFCYAGATGCASMFFFNPAHLEWSMASLFLANLGFWEASVFTTPTSLKSLPLNNTTNSAHGAMSWDTLAR